MFVLVRSVDLVDTRCKILALVLLFFFVLCACPEEPQILMS